ncbi:MAG: FGGY family carbohydrate kinase, partial [Parvibaculaceae bacterium]
MSEANVLLIGIDIGTTNLKAVALRASGQVETIARRAMVIERPFAGAAEFDLDVLDRDIVAVLKELVEGLSSKGIAAEEIAGIGIASIGESFVGLDADGR